MFKMATFNVNSINARLGHVVNWLEKNGPDVLALQELKCEDDKFPALEFTGLGYRNYIRGQKSYNGIAVLSKSPLRNVITDIPGFAIDQARYLEGELEDGTIFINIYAPNGNPPPNDPKNREKLEFKLQWFDALKAHLRDLLSRGRQIIVAGDWNVIIEEKDVYDPRGFKNNALFVPEVRAKYREIENLGFVNVIKTVLQPRSRDRLYSWWGYTRGSVADNDGVLIDHILLTPALAQRVEDCYIDKPFRKLEKASDHTPVVVELAL